MGWLGNWIGGKLKLVLIGLALAGPFVGYAGYAEIARTEHVLADGLEATARVIGGTRKTKKGSDSYTVDLSWREAGNGERIARGIKVSQALARRLFDGDRIVVNRVPIKYVPGEEGAEGVILLDDVSEQLQLDRIMMWGGPIAGGVGLLGSAWAFGLLGRLRARRRRREEFDRDGRAILGEER